MNKPIVKWLIPLALILALVLAGCATATPTPSPTQSTPTPKTSTAVTTSLPPTTSAPAPVAVPPQGPPTSTAPASKPVPASSPTPSQANSLSGAGATFPQPLYTKWFDVYNQQFNVKINYQGIGSGGGIQQITAGTVDFGASDAIMTADQQTAAEAAGGPILHIPMTSGATAMAFNLPGITSGQLKLTGDVLANIYL